MSSAVATIVKVMAFSVAFSIVIKYGLPLLPIPHTNAMALLLVILPTCILGTLLGIRSRTIASTK
ncbi:MAG TPA: hypothetical protein IGS37_18935 [Synechococcales cyanobacterium M55_K2018_004]|nr:hypothetical protein [Synechococcales cyanobacterium M55_K2018_004]